MLLATEATNDMLAELVAERLEQWRHRSLLAKEDLEGSGKQAGRDRKIDQWNALSYHPGKVVRLHGGGKVYSEDVVCTRVDSSPSPRTGRAARELPVKNVMGPFVSAFSPTTASGTLHPRWPAGPSLPQVSLANKEK